MQADNDREWTWNGFLGWAFGEARLAEVATATREATERARYLCDVPADTCVRAELIKHLGAITRAAERGALDCEAAVARRLARMLRVGGADVAALLQVRDGCEGLERSVAEQVARSAAPARCRSAA